MDSPITVAGWSNQAETFLTMIDGYKTKDMFCDCTIACREKIFRAHKIVLSMCSELFEKILLSTQDKNPVIIIQDIETWQLESLMDFMYKGETQVKDENFASLLKVVKSLQIKGFDQVKSFTNLPLSKTSPLSNHTEVQTFESQQELPLNMSLSPKRKKSVHMDHEFQKMHEKSIISTKTKRATPPIQSIDSNYNRSPRIINQNESTDFVYDRESVNTDLLKSSPREIPTGAYTSQIPENQFTSPQYIFQSKPSDGYHSRNFPTYFNQNIRPRFHERNHSQIMPLHQLPMVTSQKLVADAHKMTMERNIKMEEELLCDMDSIQRSDTCSSDEDVRMVQKYKEELVDGEMTMQNESSEAKVYYSLNNNQYIKPRTTCLKKLPPLLKITTSSFYQDGAAPQNKIQFKSSDPLLEKIPTNKRKRVRGPKSWEYLLRLLKSPTSNPSLIKWEDEAAGIFRLTRPEIIAQRWGQRTGKHIQDVLSYESFSRGLRYHYATGALCAVSEKSFVYQFGPKAQKNAPSNCSTTSNLPNSSNPPSVSMEINTQ